MTDLPAPTPAELDEWERLCREARLPHCTHSSVAELGLASREALPRLLAAYRARSALLARAREGLEYGYQLYMQAAPDAFKNGVTDYSGTIDEGDVRAGEWADSARAILAEIDAAVPEGGGDATATGGERE